MIGTPPTLVAPPSSTRGERAGQERQRLAAGRLHNWLTRLAGVVSEQALRREPEVLGTKHDGANLDIRYRATLEAQWVQVHVQGTAAGEGGVDYNASTYRSSTEVDCRSDRLQDVSVADPNTGRTIVYLIPVQYDAEGSKVLFDGEGGRPNNMAFIDAGLDLEYGAFERKVFTLGFEI